MSKSLVGAPKTDTFNGNDRRAIQAIIRRTLAAGVPGVGVGISIPGRGTLVGAFGTADLASGEAMRADHHVRIASVTKLFTATAILQLVDAQQLGLDDRLDRYVSGIPQGDRITVRQLLNHTSGVFNYTEDPAWIASFEGDPRQPFSPDKIVGIVNKPGNQPAFAAGSLGAWAYSDTNYILLGLIIEKITEAQASDIIKGRVIDRLNLDDTSFPTTSPEMPPPFAHGYLLPSSPDQPPRDVTAINPMIGWTAGAVISTVPDLMIFAKATATGALLTPALQRERLATIPTNQAPLAISYGLGILNIGGFLGHTGGLSGYGASAYCLPEADATIVVVSNAASMSLERSGLAFIELASTFFPDRFEDI